MDNDAENDPDQQPSDMQQPASPPPQQMTRRERRNRKKMILFAVGGAVLLLFLAGAVYWFFVRDTKQAAKSETNAQKQTEETVPAAQADPTPVVYKSTKFNIELTHRKDWKLKETSGGEITITSPQISYVGEDGQSGTGVFTVRMRKGVTDAMKANIEKSVAVRDSEVIAYAAPAEAQRQYTNLSYAGTKDAFKFFIVTGNAALKAGNTFIYTLPLDGEFYLFSGGYGSDASGDLSFDAVPKDSMSSTTLDQAVDIIESVKIY